MRSTHFLRLPLAMLAIALPALAAPQESRPGRPPAGEGPEFPFDGPFGGPPMRGPGPMGQHRKVVKDFDKDGDGRLDREERQAAREALKQSGNGRGRRGPGGPPGGFGRGEEPGRPGPKVAPADVKTFANAPLYQEDVVRTLFLQFADQDWEQEMADFFHTDVEVPAELTVDGRKYPGVGVRFRGASSFFMVPAGSKRSLNVSLDFTDSKQRLYGHKTLNLLNAHEDESFLHTVLYLDIARNFLPAPKANFVKVVINGESWGIYTSAQQFNKEFIAEHWKNSKGERWKVPGSPQGQGGLDYLGEEVAPYKQRYELNSGESEAAWQHLIALCRTLSQTDLEHLEEALAPMLDIDGALWFLALENVLVNNDGYWVRASDYALFRDSKGVFHVLPHDANETFSMAAGGPPGMGGGPGGRRGRGGRGPGGNGPGGNGPGGEGPGGFPGGPGGQGPGRGGRGMGPGGGGVDLDPLVGMNEQRKPLRSRLLAVPALRQRYLQHVKQLATEWLDWKKLGPMVARYRTLLRDEIQADTRKLSSYEAFLTATDDHAPATEAAQGERRRPEPSLRAFAERRRSYLLAHPALK